MSGTHATYPLSSPSSCSLKKQKTKKLRSFSTFPSRTGRKTNPLHFQRSPFNLDQNEHGCRVFVPTLTKFPLAMPAPRKRLPRSKNIKNKKENKRKGRCERKTVSGTTSTREPQLTIPNGESSRVLGPLMRALAASRARDTSEAGGGCWGLRGSAGGVWARSSSSDIGCKCRPLCWPVALSFCPPSDPQAHDGGRK